MSARWSRTDESRRIRSAAVFVSGSETQMSFHNFLLSLGVGSALLAFWFVIRFPDKTPESFGRALVHVGLALLLVPILFYTFLSGAWFFKLATDSIARYRN